MTIFGAGWFGTRTPLRGISGKTLQVLDPLTDLPIATVGPVQSNALGLYDQFETVPDVDHVVLTDGRHRQSATAIGVALSDPGTYAKAGELSALADRVEQVASDSGTSVTGKVDTFASLPAPTNRDGQAWIVADEVAMYVSDGTTWGDPIPMQGEATDAAVAFQIESGTATPAAIGPVIDARTGNGQRPIGRGEDVYRPEWYGATGDGTTNDTTALQACINAIRDAGGGTMKLTPGRTYVVVSLDVQAGLVIDGYGATFLRPPMQPNWTRTVTNQNRYALNDPRKPIVIRGLTVDGNMANQGWDGTYSLEQSSLLFFGATNTDPNQQRVIIEDVTTIGSVSDGIHFVRGIDGVVRNTKGIDCFRGGITLTGGNAKVLVDGYHGTGSVTGAHMEMEVDSPGFGDSKRCDLTIRNAVFDTPHPTAKPSQFHARGGSRITVEDAVMASGLWISGGHNVDGTGTVRLTRCTIDTYQANDCNAIRNPVDVTFDDCTIRSNNPAATSGTVKALDVVMNLSNTSPDGNRLRFIDCRWVVGSTVSGDLTIGVYNNGDYTAQGHSITFRGGSIAAGYSRGVMLAQGGTVDMDGTRLACNRGIHAARLTDRDYQITLGQLDIAPTCAIYLYMENANALCTITHKGTFLDESANVIGSISGVGANTYRGGRVILVTAAPTTATDGLLGDVARLKAPLPGATWEWACTTSSHSSATWKAKAALAA